MDPATGTYSGFDIEIAKMMSASLGFEPSTIQFKTIASANRETALQNGQIDYYVGTYTINDNRKKLVGFAGPYYLAGAPERADIAENLPGLPVELAFQVLDETGAPLDGGRLDIWHCDAKGRYSGFGLRPGEAGETLCSSSCLTREFLKRVSEWYQTR